jgi:serine/threonine protein kinase
MSTAHLDKVVAELKTHMCTNKFNVMGAAIAVEERLGRGVFGYVVKACYPLKKVYERQQKRRVLFFFRWTVKRYEAVCDKDAIAIAVKIQDMKEGDERFLGMDSYRQLTSGRTIWTEYAVMKFASRLVTRRVCPFFTPYVNIAFCSERRQSLLFMNKEDGDLYHYMSKTPLSERSLFSIVMQVCVAMYALFSQYGIVHSDLHSGNVLFHKIPRSACPGWTFLYRGNTRFTIQNKGIMCVIGDFGLSSMKDVFYSPNLSYIGVRRNDSPKVFYRDRCDILRFLKDMKALFKQSTVIATIMSIAIKIFVAPHNDILKTSDYESFLSEILLHPLLRPYLIPLLNTDTYDLNKGLKTKRLS